MNRSRAGARSRTIRITAGSIGLEGELLLPNEPRGMVIFPFASASGRFSPHNRLAAREMHEAGLGTLLAGLLTLDEENVDLQAGVAHWDIALLSGRLLAVTDWVTKNNGGLALGYFASATSAGAALVTAALRPDAIAAIVSRGGRPDLARPALNRVQAPTLFIVGGNDTGCLALNHDASERLRCENRVDVVPGVTHLYETEQAMRQVIERARDWFLAHLPERGRVHAA